MRRTSKTRLSVTALEGREVPACIVSHPTPDTVVITGNDKPDTVIIRDNGIGGVSGMATGWGAFSFSGIKHIKVATNGGGDRVAYNLIRDLQPEQMRSVQVDLGSSPRGVADQFVANLYNPATGVGSDLKAGSSLSINVAGGDGRDVIFVNAFKDTDVAPGAKLNLGLFGQAGDDIIMVHYWGENDGSVSVVADGGAGRDLERVRLHESPGSTGQLAGVVRGSDGNDNLGLFMLTANVPSQALLDGGAGTDTPFATPNVTQINFP
ncbi:MAG TPA: hypothetical protein VKD90_05905 [Gemmataceae bacterium]|nr:hypothetical protein [Gemmataceae bacterium]